MSWKCKLYELKFLDTEKQPFFADSKLISEYYCFSINTRYMSDQLFDEKISGFLNYLNTQNFEIVSPNTCNTIERQLYDEILIDENNFKDNYDIDKIKQYINNKLTKKLQPNESVNCKIYNYQLEYCRYTLKDEIDLKLLDTFVCTGYTSIFMNFEL